MEPTADQLITIFNQDTVNGIAAEVFGRENLPTALRMANLFQELSSTFLPDEQDKKEDAALTDGLARLIFGTVGRSAARKIHGPLVTQARPLGEYCNAVGAAAEEDQITSIDDKVVEPILQTRNAIFKVKLAAASLGELTELFQTAQRVDTEANLGILKLACFLTIADTLRQPEIHKSWGQIWSRRSQTIREEIEASEFGMLYIASGMLDDLRAEKGEGRYNMLHILRHSHISKRMLPIPSRTFKREYSRLSVATLAYANLVHAETWLREVKEHGEAIEARRGSLAGHQATKLVVTATELIKLGTEHIAEARDESIETSNDVAVEAEVWHQAITAEELIVAAAEGLREQIRSARLEVSPDAKTKLRDAARSKFEKQLEQMRKAETIRRLQPEIDRCMAEFKGINEFYTLSNRQFRDRNPSLISLAHTVSEIFSGNGSPDDTALRTMAGLILGVYWERTGRQPDPTKMVSQYLSDANQLRALQARSEKLGQKVDSKLLQAVNLLDELIDSGTFDDINVAERPELGPLIDFALHYLSVRDGDTKVKITPETGDKDSGAPEDEDVESARSALGELPVEIIGQAIPEDILVFPPGSSYGEIAEEYAQHTEPEDEPAIHWDRIKKLVELRDHCRKQGLNVNFIRTKQASWHRLPFFVLEVTLPDNEYGVAVVESPVYGNATYMFREADDRLPWREAVELTRQEAREWGAVPAVHVDDTQLDKHIKKLWDRIISDLTAF